MAPNIQQDMKATGVQREEAQVRGELKLHARPQIGKRLKKRNNIYKIGMVNCRFMLLALYQFVAYS